MPDIRPEDLADLTFTVAERIAQWLLDAAETSPEDIPGRNYNGRDCLCWAAYKIRTGAWREGWEMDPAKDDPRYPGSG